MLWMLLASAAALAAPPLGDVPPELAPWVDWVSARHPDLPCTPVNGALRCLWSGELALDVVADGASFRATVVADADGALALPGGPGAWPEGVTVDGRPAVVLAPSGSPAVQLSAGEHVVQGRLRWSTRPATLPLPSDAARVTLRLDGQQVAYPRVESGKLLLGKQVHEDLGGDRLSVEASRLVHDGIPLVVETRLKLLVSGSAREVDLGQVAVAGTRPAMLDTPVAARFDEQGHLVVQARPGIWELRFDAVSNEPVEALTAPTLGEAWPAVEHWAFEANPALRSVTIDGATSVDPSRTTAPGEWRSYPTYVLQPGDALALHEQRRGEVAPLPNQLQLQRELWLDHDGGGLTVRDHLSGTVHQGWRLDTEAPLALGHAAESGDDQLITKSAAGRDGVEVRNTSLDLTAESRVEGGGRSMPAVGWQTDVSSLSATLHLPPGYALVTALGVDTVAGSLIGDWTLFDFFFILVLSLGVSRLLGWRWGAVALGTLLLNRHLPGAPQWLWVFLVVTVALGRVAPEGTPQQLVRATQRTLWLFVLIAVVPLVVREVRVGVHPALAGPENYYGQDSFAPRYSKMTMDFEQAEAAPAAEDGRMDSAVRSKMRALGGSVADGDWGGLAESNASVSNRYLSAQVDPSAVMQTGPGLPQWQWRSVYLGWSGPVTQEHQLRLIVLPPWGTALLAFLRVGLLLAFATGLSGIPWPRRSGGASAVTVLGAFLLLIAAPAQAAPPSELLNELEQRIVAPPDCGACVDAPQLDLAILADRLTVTAEVHVGARAAWPLPGPVTAWTPERVLVDGRPTDALTRAADGVLWVRLEPGVHRVSGEGALPVGDSHALRFEQLPHRVSFNGPGWVLDGLKADGTPQASVQLTRAQQSATSGGAPASQELAPWVQVERRLDLGLPWRVETIVTRMGAVTQPLSLKIPLLAGEDIVDGRHEAREGVAQVVLQRGQSRTSWLSTLAERDELVLQAPTDVPWTETWSLSCGAMFRCAWDGVAPITTVGDTSMNPQWRVWPGEQVRVQVSRPAATAGQTTTVDRVSLEVTPGRRQLLAELQLHVRATEAGTRPIRLPEGARVQDVRVDGSSAPVRASDAGVLDLPIAPGDHSFVITWQQERGARVNDVVPAVDIGGPAVNATITVNAMSERWIVLLLGPSWGPVPLFWSYLIALAIFAPLLSRIPWTPLRTRHWLLLGLGMVHVPVALPMIVGGWFVAMGYRRKHPAQQAALFDVGQLLLVGYTLVFAACLYGAVHAGLLWAPDMQVDGPASSDHTFTWFVDRVDGALPQPTVLWLPMWTWRVLMLAWSLWLANSLVRWLPWAWSCWSAEGMFRAVGLATKRRQQAAALPQPEPPVEPPTDPGLAPADEP